MWMWDGCKVYMYSYMASNGPWFMVTWTILKNDLFEVGLTKKLGDHDTLNAHNHWFILFYRVWGFARIEIHWDSIWLRATTPEDPQPHYMFWRCFGTTFGECLWTLTNSWTWLLAHVGSGSLVDAQLDICIQDSTFHEQESRKKGSLEHCTWVNIDPLKPHIVGRQH